MIKQVISGGQTGVDRAAFDVGLALAYGDVLPPGFTLIQPRAHSTTVPRAVPGADPP